MFDHAHPKIIEITLSFPEFSPVYSINLFLRYSQFLSLMARLVTPIFDHAHPKFFDQLLIYVILYQYEKKSDYFTDFIWRYGWLKNPAI